MASWPSKAAATGLHSLIHAGLAWFWLWPWDGKTRLYAALYTFLVHYAIDFSRTFLETGVFSSAEVKVFRRQDVFRWAIGRDRGASEVHAFMEKNTFTWSLLNIVDQGLHVLSMALFAWYVQLP